MCSVYFYSALFRELSLFDKLLTPLILVFMIIGIVIGEFSPSIRDALNTVQFHSVSVREFPRYVKSRKC